MELTKLLTIGNLKLMNKLEELVNNFKRVLGLEYKLYEINNGYYCSVLDYVDPKLSNVSTSFTKGLFKCLTGGGLDVKVKGLDKSDPGAINRVVKEVKKQMIGYSNPSNEYHIIAYFNRRKDLITLKAKVNATYKVSSPDLPITKYIDAELNIELVTNSNYHTPNILVE